MSGPPDGNARLGAMFSSIAPRYDLLNTLLSVGLHRRWKRRAAALARCGDGGLALDIASGTGDLAQLLARGGARVALLDLSPEMLRLARRKMAASPVLGYVQADAEHLPFAGGAFAAITIGFGLRNVADRAGALREMLRVLAPGGRLVVLEFSTPRSPVVRWLYDRYSSLIPRLGGRLSGNPGAYRYLVASIRDFPARGALTAMIRAAGFEEVHHADLAFGIVAIHVGTRP